MVNHPFPLQFKVFFILIRDLFSIYFAEFRALEVHVEIILTFFGTKLTKYQNPIIPFQTDIGRYCSRYGYSDILFRCFSKPILQFFCKTDTIYWFIAQHYLYAFHIDGTVSGCDRKSDNESLLYDHFNMSSRCEILSL